MDWFLHDRELNAFKHGNEMKIEKLYGFHSALLFFEHTYMLLQNICINNGAACRLEQKKKTCKTALYGTIGERGETEVNG